MSFLYEMSLLSLLALKLIINHLKELVNLADKGNFMHKLAKHFLCFEDLPRHGGRLEMFLNVDSTFDNVRNHQLQLPAGEHRADHCSHLEYFPR